MNNIPHLNIDELYETKQKSDMKKVELFNKLLIKIHDKIKIASRQKKNENFCYFVMPEVLIGSPNYNFQECLLYILSCLQSDGFLTKYIHPNLILITWSHIVPKYVRDEFYKKTGKNIDKYGAEISETGKPYKQKLITESVNKNKETKKEYKPSGKFIYDTDLLNKIQDIL